MAIPTGKPHANACDFFPVLGKVDLNTYLPEYLRGLSVDQRLIPTLAKDKASVQSIAEAIQRVPTQHDLHLGDSTKFMPVPASQHLVVTSPPYWTLKRYAECHGQLGHVDDFELFLDKLDAVWRSCFEALVPGGRLVIVVGDVCVARRKNKGRHLVVPLPAHIAVRCQMIGFENLTGPIWKKIANAAYESGGTGMFGSPYEPNGIIKNDRESILIQRKPGPRSRSDAQRLLSVISVEDQRRWFQSEWNGLPGSSTKAHPAPFPLELAERIVRMYSYVGDTVYDPFLGTGTTALAAARWGRNSVGVEIDPGYYGAACGRFSKETSSMASAPILRLHGASRQ